MSKEILTGVARIRRRRRRFVWFCLATMLALPGLDAISASLGATTPTVRLVLLVGYVCVFLLVTNVFWLSTCPRCEYGFFQIGPINWPFARRCLHCKLSLKKPIALSQAEAIRVHQWLANASPGDPIPDWGLTCPTCGYCLNGLREEICPECGKAFSISGIATEVIAATAFTQSRKE